MANERITESLTRSLLKSLSYYDEDKLVVVEEQKSKILEVTKLLKKAGKAGKGGRGSPEFIITSLGTPDFVIIIECKASTHDHESREHDNPVKYAVDGALHYGMALQQTFNVIAVGISGQTQSSLKISSYLLPKQSKTIRPLKTTKGKVVKNLLSWEDYIRYGTYDPEVTKQRETTLMEFSRELHDFMRDHAKLTEGEKPLVVSGTLIALRNKPFAESFTHYEPADLQKQWMTVIGEELKKAEIPNSKKSSMTQPYSSIAVHPELGKPTQKFPKGVLHELIKMLNDRVWPFISVYHDFDVVGQFYGEFLKYTGGDKKALGIVLTPRHVTELFSELANVSPTDRVLDTCAGTGGFLISAMHHMFKKTESSEQREEIKKNALVGIEQQPNMYALAASNMILRGDGKANLYQGSCFDKKLSKTVKKHACNVSMINPPYSQSDNDLHELYFMKHSLDCLVKGGTGMAIVPMSCGISPHPLKEEILKHHTLDAVMSMPDELFYPVGVVTCIMIFTAHVPHEISDRSTWFGYWKNDGFVKTKKQGRIDEKSVWQSLKKSWVRDYRDRNSVVGKSVKIKVNHKDEWCAEAYMKTDYASISKQDYRTAVSKYLIFNLFNEAANFEEKS